MQKQTNELISFWKKTRACLSSEFSSFGKNKAFPLERKTILLTLNFWKCYLEINSLVMYYEQPLIRMIVYLNKG